MSLPLPHRLRLGPRFGLKMLLAGLLVLGLAYALYGPKWTADGEGQVYCTRCGVHAIAKYLRLGRWTRQEVSHVRESGISSFLRRHWADECRQHRWGEATWEGAECAYFTNIFLDQDLSDPVRVETFDALATARPEEAHLLFAILLDGELDPARDPRGWHLSWNALQNQEFNTNTLSTPAGVFQAVDRYYRKRGMSWPEVRAEAERRLAARGQ